MDKETQYNAEKDAGDNLEIVAENNQIDLNQTL